MKYYDRKYQNIPDDNTTIGYTSLISKDGIAKITSLTGQTTATIGSVKEPLRARLMQLIAGANRPYLFLNLNTVAPQGHWTISSHKTTSNSAYIIYVTTSSYMRFYKSSLEGVRPVINLKI